MTCMLSVQTCRSRCNPLQVAINLASGSWARPIVLSDGNGAGGGEGFNLKNSAEGDVERPSRRTLCAHRIDL